MTATVLQFPEQPPPNDGNGALSVVRDYLERVNPARVMARAILEKGDGFEGLDALPDPDHLLAWLWEQGFKIVPIEDEDLGH